MGICVFRVSTFPMCTLHIVDAFMGEFDTTLSGLIGSSEASGCVVYGVLLRSPTVTHLGLQSSSADWQGQAGRGGVLEIDSLCGGMRVGQGELEPYGCRVGKCPCYVWLKPDPKCQLDKKTKFLHGSRAWFGSTTEPINVRTLP